MLERVQFGNALIGPISENLSLSFPAYSCAALGIVTYRQTRKASIGYQAVCHRQIGPTCWYHVYLRRVAARLPKIAQAKDETASHCLGFTVE